MSKTAHILAFRKNDIANTIGVNFGSKAAAAEDAFPPVWAGPRPYLETDDNWLQPIPYLVVKRVVDGVDQFLIYRRGAQCNEERLRGTLAVGIGGHIDVADAVIVDETGEIHFLSTVQMACYREAKEEMGVGRAGKIIGYIQCDTTEVDTVHFGVVMLWDATEYLNDGGRFAWEPGIDEPTFMTKKEILSVTDAGIETWTKLALDLV